MEYTRKDLANELGVHPNTIDNYLRKMRLIHWPDDRRLPLKGALYPEWVLDELRLYKESLSWHSFEEYKKRTEQRLGTYSESESFLIEDDEEEWLPAIVVEEASLDPASSPFNGFSQTLASFTQEARQNLIQQSFQEGRALGHQINQSYLAGLQLELAAGTQQLLENCKQNQQVTDAQINKQAEQRVLQEKKRFRRRSSSSSV